MCRTSLVDERTAEFNTPPTHVPGAMTTHWQAPKSYEIIVENHPPLISTGIPAGHKQHVSRAPMLLYFTYLTVEMKHQCLKHDIFNCN